MSAPLGSQPRPAPGESPTVRLPQVPPPGPPTAADRRGVTRPPAPRRRLGRFAGALVLALGLSVFTVPDLWFGLDRNSPFAQVVSFRPLLLAGVLVVGTVLALITLGIRWAWPFPAAVLALAAVTAGLLVPRAVADPVPPEGTPLRVVSLNAYEGQADLAAFAALIRSERPDVVAVPESGERYRTRLARLIEPDGYRTYSSTGRESRDVNGVTLAVADRLGDVSVRYGDAQAMTFPFVEVTGGGLGNLRFVAFHSVAPTPGEVPRWAAELAGLQQWCGSGGPAVVSGDFNATLDHSAFRAGIRGCADAAAQRGAGLTGTWPSWLPEWLGPQIDHVVATEGIRAESFSVHQMPGSDHRAIVATLRLP